MEGGKEVEEGGEQEMEGGEQEMKGGEQEGGFFDIEAEETG